MARKYNQTQPLITELFSVETETALLGALFLDINELRVVRPLLGNGDGIFWLSDHEAIYKAILALVDTGAMPDFASVSDYLERNGKQISIDKLIDTASNSYGSVYAEYHAKSLYDYAVRRNAVNAAQEVARMAYDTANTDMATLQCRSQQIMDETFQGLNTPWSAAISGADLLEISARQQNKLLTAKVPNGLITGYATLDNRLVPLPGGGLMYVLAPTSTGKTTLALTMMKANVRRGHKPVLYFNELTIEDLINRILIMESVDFQAWRNSGGSGQPMPRLLASDLTGRGVATDDPAYRDAAGRMSEWVSHCTFVPCYSWSAERIVSDFQSLAFQGKADQVFVDYLDLIPYSDRGNIAEDIGVKLATLKAGAAATRFGPDDLGLPLVVTGQPRKGFDSSNKPTMDDAFGSVRIQQFATQFLIMWRERINGEDTGYTSITIAKNPMGGNEGYEAIFRVAGTKERRGFVLYPCIKTDRPE